MDEPRKLADRVEARGRAMATEAMSRTTIGAREDMEYAANCFAVANGLRRLHSSSEFRTFCIGSFTGAGIFAAALDHGVTAAPGDLYAQLIAVGFLAGCLSVWVFGRLLA